MNHTMFQLSRIVTVVLLLAGALGIPPGTARANAGAVFTITSTSDADNGGDSVCSLREAMKSVLYEADYHECIHTGTFGDDLIVFAISGSPTITLLANLPGLNSSTLTIDGWNSGSPVVIDGANAYQPFSNTGSSSLTLQYITVQHGYGTYGGGVGNSGTLYVLNSAFLNNVATADGGAILNVGSAGIVTIVNSTFSGNEAVGGGGGLENNSGTATVLNSTFSGNIAAIGGGALDIHKGTEALPATTVKNTIMANSTAPQDCKWFASDGTLTGDHNIIETTAGGTSSCSSITASTADPALGSPAGSPAYLPLLLGSPALDAGGAGTCSAAPVNGLDQRGITRPQGAACDIGAFEARFLTTTVAYRSLGSQDGWLLESSETSGKAGTSDATATQFYLGDDAGNKQYRGILSFDTSALPDTAVVTAVTVKIKKTGLVGTNPFSSLGNIIVDVKKGPFSGNPALQLTDFYAAGSKNYITKFTNSPVSNWYSTTLGSSGFGYINLTGPTQFRLRFATDDNNNHVADYLKFASGNAITSSRPVLTITYYDP